ncbi:hypothetical protein O3P69_020156 [Scylla paramamosain]|uniref:Uncharacterized protein n=1 Tax=Scylla paramamosain TaxID=85552 RepID=A0AAW0TLI0_SCYPA
MPSHSSLPYSDSTSCSQSLPKTWERTLPCSLRPVLQVYSEAAGYHSDLPHTALALHWLHSLERDRQPDSHPMARVFPGPGVSSACLGRPALKRSRRREADCELDSKMNIGKAKRLFELGKHGRATPAHSYRLPRILGQPPTCLRVWPGPGVSSSKQGEDRAPDPALLQALPRVLHQQQTMLLPIRSCRDCLLCYCHLTLVLGDPPTIKTSSKVHVVAPASHRRAPPLLD